MTPSRYSELGYHNYSGTWRFVDRSTGKAVGPHYKSNAELLGDIERFAAVFGCEGAYFDPTPEALPSLPSAKRVRTSDATNDIENAFKMWGIANNSIPEEAPHEVFAGEERAAIEAQDRVTTWLTQVAADQRQLHAALLACQALSAVTDYSDVDAIHRARKMAMDAIAEEY